MSSQPLVRVFLSICETFLYKDWNISHINHNSLKHFSEHISLEMFWMLMQGSRLFLAKICGFSSFPFPSSSSSSSSTQQQLNLSSNIFDFKQTKIYEIYGAPWWFLMYYYFLNVISTLNVFSEIHLSFLTALSPLKLVNWAGEVSETLYFFKKSINILWI